MPIEQVAAVTFTERAAAELRDRLRDRFEQAARHTTRPEARERAEAALDGLDLAAIGTLHSFAQRILTEHPIEAGIPPLLGVLDEVGSSVAFEARWAQLRTELLDDEEMALTLELAFAVGITLDHLRSIIVRLNGDWDLVRSHVLAAARPRAAHRARRRRASSPRRGGSSPRATTARTPTTSSSPTSPRSRRGSATSRPPTTTRAPPSPSSAQAEKLKWSLREAGQLGRPARRRCRSDCKRGRPRSTEVVATVSDQALRAVVRWCGERVLESAEQRRAAGELEFHDLLVLARDVLRENAEVRAQLQSRYTRLLLDEFQDTDPIQIEIAVRIAGGAAAGADRWEDCPVPPGSIFVVGDPKQSIYRFRRADIGMYLRAREVLGGDVTLTTNFRTGAPDPRLGQRRLRAAHRGGPGPASPRTWPSTSTARAPRSARPSRSSGRPSTTACAPPRCASARRPTSRAPSSPRSRRGGPPRPSSGTTSDGEPLTRVAPDHPRRHHHPRPGPHLAAVPRGRPRRRRHRLPHRVELARLLGRRRSATSSPPPAPSPTRRMRSRWSRRCARRSSGAGTTTCGRGSAAAGRSRCSPRSTTTPPTHPVGAGIRYLQRLHYDARWMTPSEVLGRIATDRRMFEVAVFSPRARDAWRRLRFVIDQARAWSESEHGGLRAYLAWAAAQSSEGSRVAESVLPETDVDSVRIMTIHAAKGLEFPMVVLSGMSSAPEPGARGAAAVDRRRLRRQGRQRHRDPGLRRAAAARRADERPRADAAALRRRDPGPRPPRRVAAPGEDPAERDVVVERHPPRRGGCRDRGGCRAAGLGRRRRPSRPGSAGRSPRRRSSRSGWRGCAPRWRRAAGCRRSARPGSRAPTPTPSRRRCRCLRSRGTPPTWWRRPTRPARRSRPASPRAPATSSSRRGPRAATGRPSAGPSTGCSSRSTCGPAPGSRTPSPPSASPRASSSSPTSSPPWPARPSPTTSSAAPPSASTGASPTSGRSRRTAPSSRASSTSSTARTTARSSSSTTRPTTSPTPPSPPARRTTSPSSTPTAASSVAAAEHVGEPISWCSYAPEGS